MKYLTLFICLVLSLGVIKAHSADIELKGKAVLVTGASSGIGKKVAETLASKGVFVYAGARKPTDIKALSSNRNIGRAFRCY